MDQDSNTPALSPAPEQGPHVDGFRVAQCTVPEPGQGTLLLTLSIMAGGAERHATLLHTAADDADGRAEMSRIRPLCEAIASYLNFGGKPRDVAAVAATFQRLGAVSMLPAVVHVLTTVEVTRRHVIRSGADCYLLVTEGVSTEELTRDEVVRRVAGAEYDLARDPADDDDWSFLDAMRARGEGGDAGEGV